MPIYTYIGSEFRTTIDKKDYHFVDGADYELSDKNNYVLGMIGLGKLKMKEVVPPASPILDNKTVKIEPETKK